MSRRDFQADKDIKPCIANSKHWALTDRAIRAALQPYGVSLGEAQVEAIRRYASILLLWNQKLNLTSLRNPTEILGRHFGESLFALAVVPVSSGRLADVGSGAGFPGLALKAARPELDVHLIESNSKKAVFLTEVARTLGVRVEIHRGRYQELRPDPHSFDFVTTRALGDPRLVLRWARATLKETGRVVLWLGAGDAARTSSSLNWTWREPIPIPQSLRRVLLIGKPRGG